MNKHLGAASRVSGDIVPHAGYTYESLSIDAEQNLTISVSHSVAEADLKIGYVDARGRVLLPLSN